MHAVNANLANESYAQCMKYLKNCDIDVFDSLVNKMSKAVTDLFPQGGEETEVTHAGKAGIIIRRLDAILSKIGGMAKTMQDKIEHTAGSVLKDPVSRYYLENLGCAHEHGVIIDEQETEPRIVQPIQNQDPMDMSAFNPRHITETMKKEVLDFLKDNPRLATREGLSVQEIGTNEYLVKQKETFSRVAVSQKMKYNPETKVFISERIPEMEREKGPRMSPDGMRM